MQLKFALKRIDQRQACALLFSFLHPSVVNNKGLSVISVFHQISMNAIRRLITATRVPSAQTHVVLTNAPAARDMLETVLLVTDTQVRFFTLTICFGTAFVECSLVS